VDQGGLGLRQGVRRHLRSRPVPLREGVAGAVSCIYHGEVSEDSDGRIEWCRPVPGVGLMSSQRGSLSPACVSSPPAKRPSCMSVREPGSVRHGGSSSPKLSAPGAPAETGNRATPASG
jgi:hypothetical protein